MSDDLPKNSVFVVVAPSGTGKTTLNLRLVQELQDKIEMSVSHTTRDKRPTEIDGKHYHFVNEAVFNELAESKMLLEWANVFGNFYGTSLTEVERIKSKGKKVLLEIDVQGWHYAKKRIPDATSIFILPPSVKDLWKRLEKRGTDSLEVRWRRIQTARKELECAGEYEHFIINEDLETAYSELKGVILGDPTKLHLSHDAGLEHASNLLDEFQNANWLQNIGELVNKNKVLANN